jgi:hypothetical protein
MSSAPMMASSSMMSPESSMMASKSGDMGVPAMQTGSASSVAQASAENPPKSPAVESSMAQMPSISGSMANAGAPSVETSMPSYSTPATANTKQSAETLAVDSPMSNEASMPSYGSASMANVEQPAATAAVADSASQYGSPIVPGSAPTQAPYPVGGESPVVAGGVAPSGTLGGVAMPTGTGSVSGTQEFEGAASSLHFGGLLAGMGAVIAVMM